METNEIKNEINQVKELKEEELDKVNGGIKIGLTAQELLHQNGDLSGEGLIARLAHRDDIQQSTH